MANILIADDHPFFRMGVITMLEASGHTLVGAANDAAEALQILRSADPEILLLDIRLPDTDGITLLRELRESDDNRRIIILTVELTDEQLGAALKWNADGIVFKHESEERLLAAIDAVAAGGSYIDESLRDRLSGRPDASAVQSPLDNLTPREREVAKAVATGMRNREIAGHLSTTEGTVKVHVHRILTKLGISNRAELTAIVVSGKG